MINIAALTGVAASTGAKDNLSVITPGTGNCPTGTCGTDTGTGGTLTTTTTTNETFADKAFGGRFTEDAFFNNLWTTLICGDDAKPIASNTNDIRGSSIWLRTAKCSLADLAKLINVKDGKFSLDVETITKRLKANILGIAQGDNSSITEAILKDIDSYAGTDLATGYVVVNGVRKDIKDADLDSAKGVTEFLNTIATNDDVAEFFDIQTELAILGSVVNEAVRLGIPQAIDIIAGKIQDDKARRKFLIDNLESSATSSDLESVNYVLDEIGVPRSLAKVPDLVTILTGYYSKSNNADDVKEYDVYLISTLDKINVNWHSKPITNLSGVEGITYLKDLKIFSRASRGAKRAFNSTGYMRYVNIAAVNKPMGSIDRAARRYLTRR